MPSLSLQKKGNEIICDEGGKAGETGETGQNKYR